MDNDQESISPVMHIHTHYWYGSNIGECYNHPAWSLYYCMCTGYIPILHTKHLGGLYYEICALKRMWIMIFSGRENKCTTIKALLA